LNSNISNINVSLPLGISFYTFQLISYIIDVKRRTVEPQKQFYKFLLYVSLFPQLIAGPIVRYQDVAQAIEKRESNSENFINGLYRFSIGLSKKIIIANVLGQMCKDIFSVEMERISMLGSWLGVFTFALQIYFDFSGYSDMAIGLCKIFGFNIKENFNYPYIATTITDYWKRWHISLSSFFRDYVYIPLGGKYSGQIRNLIIVWALTGLWHGASYNFILWGLYFCIVLLFEKYVLIKLFKNKNGLLENFIGRIWTIFIILIANNIFYFTNFDKMVFNFKNMFMISSGKMSDALTVSLLKENFVLIVLSVILTTPLVNNLMENLFIDKKRAIVLKTILVIILISFSTINMLGQSYNPFLYFRF
jgi:alginate O-acetyltransferase complex protein AlgI